MEEHLKKKFLQKGETMLVDLVKKGFGLLWSALKKFKIQNEEILYITSEADHVFSSYMEQGVYDKIGDICEEDFFNSIVEYSLNSSQYNIDDYINVLLDQKGNIDDNDREVVISFFHKIRDIIVEAQTMYGIKDSENKIISKQIQAIQESIDKYSSNAIEHNPICLIGILACDANDSRTKELMGLKEGCLLDLNEYISKLENVQEIVNQIELFKATLNNDIYYKVKLACSYSIAYLVGAVFSQKISNLTFINRDNEWRIGKAEKIKLSCKTNCGNKKGNVNVAITIGTTSYIDDDVRLFIGNQKSLITIHYDENIQSSEQFNAIGNEITKKLKKIALDSDAQGPINLFYRGPVEIMFLLGQKSNDFGQCTIFEYNFKERDIKKKTYTKGITF